MTVVFTLCSKNYLGQSTTLYDSFKKYNPDILFFIGLVDRLDEKELSQLTNYKLLQVDDLESEAVKSMYTRYNLIELNTAVKPYYIDYFFKKYKADKVIYFDPDILITAPITYITDQLDNYSFILTPHSCSPIYDSYMLTEQVTLATGTFNLGFFAVKNDTAGNSLINWWSRKLYDECIMDLSRSYFVDQKWMNLSVCYFEPFLVSHHLGMNMAHWNLHERNLTEDGNGGYLVNDTYPLIFFHFSSFKPDRPDAIADWQNRFTFESRPDIQPIFKYYALQLAEHKYQTFKQWKPVYGLPVPSPAKNKLKNRIKQSVKQLVGKK